MTAPTPAASHEVAVPHPLQIAGLTATQHAIGTAYAYRLRGSTEEMLDRLETERDDEVYRRVCRQLRFDPRDGATS